MVQTEEVKVMAKKKSYDVGLGREYFYAFVPEQEKPIARIRADETNSHLDVMTWASAQAKKYRARK